MNNYYTRSTSTPLLSTGLKLRIFRKKSLHSLLIALIMLLVLCSASYNIWVSFLTYTCIPKCEMNPTKTSSENISCKNISKFPSILIEYNFSYVMTIEERVKYYLTPKWYSYFTTAIESTDSNSMDIILNGSLFYNGFENNSKTLQVYDRFIAVSAKSLRAVKDSKSLKCDSYCIDSLYMLNLSDIKCKYHSIHNRYVMQFGDGSTTVDNYPTKIPVFIKSRYVSAEDAILLKLKKHRHFSFYFDVEAYDVPWEEKNNQVLWRGSMTGGENRYTLVNKYHKYFQTSNITNVTIDGNIDIAFTKKNQNYERWKAKGMITDHLLRRKMSKEEMLRSKYLVTIPGNDVATNFNWILYSNSVPFAFSLPAEQCKHVKETWAMHGLTLPYIHYVPFTLKNDEDDSLFEAFEFCESHPKNCSQIARNGKQWMMQFRDREKEDKIKARMLSLYCHSIRVI